MTVSKTPLLPVSRLQELGVPAVSLECSGELVQA